jgi:hypothetical protein
MKKTSKHRYLEVFVLSLGRGERIRTFDPLVPNQMRYQAALRPDSQHSNRMRDMSFRCDHIFPFNSEPIPTRTHVNQAIPFDLA